MPIKAKENSLGAWTFLLGVILSVIIGLATTLIPIPEITSYSPQIYAILIILGIIVGFMNVASKESQTFLLAGAVLVIVSKFGMDSVTGSLVGVGVGEAVRAVFGALLVLFVPATIIVALKSVFGIAKI
jgi:hypothetical protein